MNIFSFRNGIVRRQTDFSNTPKNVQIDPNDPTYLDFVSTTEPTVLLFAHGDKNYLVELATSVEHAWGPLPARRQNQWLYWDVSLLTGAVTFGATINAPIAAANAPLNPAPDQHWFDLSTTTMKVWSSGKWVNRIRVFAALYDDNAVLQFNPLGSQVGLTGSHRGGKVMFGAGGQPVRDTDGTFMVVDVDVGISSGNSNSVGFDAMSDRAIATESIPKFAFVTRRFEAGKKKVSLASSTYIGKYAHGMVIEDLWPGEVGLVVNDRVVKNDLWSFTADQVGKYIFCGPDGLVTTVPPKMGFSQICGVVSDRDEIHLSITPPTIVGVPQSGA